MIQESYFSEEKTYVAGRDVTEALGKAGGDTFGRDTPQEAWNVLGYWDREEHSDSFEVFEVVTTTRVTKVDPPYMKRN